MQSWCWVHTNRISVMLIYVERILVWVVQIVSQGVSAALRKLIQFVLIVLEAVHATIIWTSVIVGILALISGARIKLSAGIAYLSVFRLHLWRNFWALVQFVELWECGCIIRIRWLISTFRMTLLAIEMFSRHVSINVVLKWGMKRVGQIVMNQTGSSSPVLNVHCRW